MVYLAQLLVVMTDGLKIVRICVRNVPRKRTQAPRRRRVSRITLSLQESDVVAYVLMRRDAVLLKHKKSSADNLCMSKKVVVTVYPLHFDTKSEQSDCNKSSVR